MLTTQEALSNPKDSQLKLPVNSRWHRNSEGKVFTLSNSLNLNWYTRLSQCLLWRLQCYTAANMHAATTSFSYGSPYAAVFAITFIVHSEPGACPGQLDIAWDAIQGTFYVSVRFEMAGTRKPEFHRKCFSFLLKH